MQNLHKTAYLATALIRRKLCKIAFNMSYLNDNGLNDFSFPYTHKITLYISSLLCRTYRDMNATDCT